MSKENTTQGAKTEDIVVTRIINAPIEQVWKAWTDPERVQRWWGPKDYTSPYVRIDLREGGKFVFAMRAPEEQGGQEQYSSGVYKKIEPMRRLEFVQSMSDKDGNAIDPVKLGMPADFPKEKRTEVTFRKIKCGMTELTVVDHDWTPGQMFVYSIAGWNQSIDKLARSAS